MLAMIAVMMFHCGTLRAQQDIRATVGDDFWIAFIENGGDQRPQTFKLVAMGTEACQVTATNPLTHWSYTASLPADGTAEIVLPSDAVCDSGMVPTAKAFHVTSTADIHLVAFLGQVASSGATMVLPTSALRKRYIVLDYTTDTTRMDISGAAVLMVAIEDSTLVSMRLPCALRNSTLQAGDSLHVALSAGQSYMMVSSSGSFSGMEMTANRRFALFEGNRITGVPVGNESGDYMMEQAVPVDMWGQEFAVVSTRGRTTGDQVRVVASDDCVLTTSPGGTYTMAAGGQLTLDMPSFSHMRLSATAPVCVGLCSKSSTYYGEYGDATLTLIPPLDRGVNQASAFTFPTQRISDFYVNIIALSEVMPHVNFDGVGVMFQVMDSNYCYSRLQVENGRHTVTCDSGCFVAWTYGQGRVEAYSYNLGLLTDAFHFDTVDVYDTVCQGEPFDSCGIHLSATATMTPGSLVLHGTVDTTYYIVHLVIMPNVYTDIAGQLLWDSVFLWGDTMIDAPGMYTQVFTAASGCDSVVTLTLTYRRDTVLVADSCCQNSPYAGYGFSIDSSQTASVGHLLVQRDTVENGHPLCYLLRLTVMPMAHVRLEMQIVVGDTLWYNGVPLNLRGVYDFLFTAANGCDSVVTVVLNYESVGISASANGICPGDEVVLTATGTHAIFWSSEPYDPELEAQQGMNPVTVHPMQTTQYRLHDEDGNVVASTIVGTDMPPTLCIQQNRDVLDFDQPVLVLTDCSEGRHSTAWLFTDGWHASGKTMHRRYQQPLPDSVEVTMTSCNRFDCCADTTIVIQMRINSVWFPNVFTPSEDNNNLFQCFTSFVVDVFSLDIFNRWGLSVWSTQDIGQGWDGRSADGTVCPQGAYSYRYYLKATDGSIRQGIGTVTLLR